MLESLFNEVVGLRPEGQTPTQVLSCKKSEILKNTYLEEHLRTKQATASKLY